MEPLPFESTTRPLWHKDAVSGGGAHTIAFGHLNPPVIGLLQQPAPIGSGAVAARVRPSTALALITIFSIPGPTLLRHATRFDILSVHPLLDIGQSRMTADWASCIKSHVRCAAAKFEYLKEGEIGA